MDAIADVIVSKKPIHPWLRQIHAAFVPGPLTPLLEEMLQGLERHLRRLGHEVQATPNDSTDVIFTTAPFGRPLDWRQALIFTARQRFNLRRTPTIFTIVQIEPIQYRHLWNHFSLALSKAEPDPSELTFPGMAPEGYRILYEQGRRGGPILALERLVQAQAKSIRVILVIGDKHPSSAFLFDLVGSYPSISAEDQEAFYEDIILRITTILSTSEVNKHQVVGDSIPGDLWGRLSTPQEMLLAAHQLGRREFFTEMIRIADLVSVPVVSDAVASQYSEGCFATWDPTLGALIATITGSARPVYKGNITEDDLAVIVGVRDDGQGALVRHVEGKRNDPPSSEAVEMMDMDSALPTVVLGPPWPDPIRVPVVRSKLHGHRGICSYHPAHVEFVPLDLAYYHYPVSCGTDAQARAIKEAFARSEALRNPADQRQVVFTILPGHGAVIVEKWVPYKSPFQVIWEYIDVGYLVVDRYVPQGLLEYVPGPTGIKKVRFLSALPPRFRGRSSLQKNRTTTAKG